MGRGLSDLQKTILLYALHGRRENGGTLRYRLTFTKATTAAHTLDELRAKVGDIAPFDALRWSATKYAAGVNAGNTLAEAEAIKTALESRGLGVGQPRGVLETKHGRDVDFYRTGLMRICYADAIQRAKDQYQTRAWYQYRRYDNLVHLRTTDRKGYQAAHAALSKAIDRLQARGLLVGHIITELGIAVAEALEVSESELLAKLSWKIDNLANSKRDVG